MLAKVLSARTQLRTALCPGILFLDVHEKRACRLAWGPQLFHWERHIGAKDMTGKITRQLKEKRRVTPGSEQHIRAAHRKVVACVGRIPSGGLSMESPPRAVLEGSRFYVNAYDEHCFNLHLPSPCDTAGVCACAVFGGLGGQCRLSMGW